MPDVMLTDDEVRVGDRFAVSFQRTLRIPDDGRRYPLPPGLGKIPVRSADDYGGRIPVARRGCTFALPLYQREALWLAFEGAAFKPNAVKIGVGAVDALTGGEWNECLSMDPQNYVVVPDQPWLDGFHVAAGVVRQFVAVALGTGLSVESQLAEGSDSGALQVMVFEPKPGRFPERAPPPGPQPPAGPMASAPGGIGLGAGGKMQQKIYPDRYGVETWDPGNTATVTIFLLNSAMYRELTGHEPPPTSISARTYTEFGLPWFSIYDEHLGDVETADRLRELRSVRDLEHQRGQPPRPEDDSIDPDESSIRRLRLDEGDDPHGGRES